MRIFVTGGTGFVGRHLQRELLSRGHTLRLLVHRGGHVPEKNVEEVAGDITAPENLPDLLADCEAVINLVGIIREFPARGITFQRLHVEAAANLVGAARERGVKRFVQMSALGARPDASSAYHRTKFQAEEVLRSSGLDYTIFRPSIIFGPGDGFVNLLAGYIRKFSAVPVIGNGSYRLQPISVRDVARCFAEAVERPETSGRTFEICGPDRLTYNRMLELIGRTMGRSKVIRIHTPVPFLKAVVPVLQNFSFFPLSMDQMKMLLEENICDSGWRETFRFDPESFQQGIASYLH